MKINQDPKYHVPGSHLICEHGKPIIQSTLWQCIERIRDLESNMTRMYEHSPFTILPTPDHNREDTPSLYKGPVRLYKPEYEREMERGER